PFSSLASAPSGDRLAIAFDRRGREWQARIELEDASHEKKGARSLASRENTCDELVSAVSLAVALALDPMRLSPAGSASAPSPPTPPSPAEDRAEAPPPPPPPDDRAQPSHVAGLG